MHRPVVLSWKVDSCGAVMLLGVCGYFFQTALCAVLAPPVLLAVSLQASAQVWQSQPQTADWPGFDFTCSPGSTPLDSLCNPATVGAVAVCWDVRPTGECGGAVAWCTYKNVPPDAPASGNAPGAVYKCEQ